MPHLRRPPFVADTMTPTSGSATPTILLSSDQIQARICELAADIEQAYQASEDLHLICVLKGAFMFLSDLVRALTRPVTLDFMAVSSYAKGTTSSGEVRLVKDLDFGLEGRNVMIVEDVVDTGLTLHYMQEILRARSPNSLATTCLLNKPSRRAIDVRIDFVGFTIPDVFVVGYGLDYAELHRNLPYIAVLFPEAPA